jgi:hypothetical protein
MGRRRDGETERAKNDKEIRRWGDKGTMGDVRSEIED